MLKSFFWDFLKFIFSLIKTHYKGICNEKEESSGDDSTDESSNNSTESSYAPSMRWNIF